MRRCHSTTTSEGIAGEAGRTVAPRGVGMRNSSPMHRTPTPGHEFAEALEVLEITREFGVTG